MKKKITLRESSQTQKDHLVSFHLCEMSRKSKSTYRENRLVVGWAGDGNQDGLQMGMKDLSEVKLKLKLESNGGCTTLEFTKNH